MSNAVVAIGSNQLWSFSPAIDLLERFPPPPPSQLPQHAANAVATPAPASTSAPTPAPAPASSGKSGVSSALARLLLAASAPPAAAATTDTPNDLSGRGALSMLLVDSGDILSAFKTIVRSHAHRAPGAANDTPLDVYLLDGEPSATARHLLLVAIAFDTQLSLRGRTELFLEVYGNSLIQEKTQLYINRKVKSIRAYISTLQTLPGSKSSAEGAALGATLFRSLVDLSHLKNKEVDALEAALDFFATPMTRPTLQAPPTATTSDAAAAATAAAPASASSSAQAGVSAISATQAKKDANAFDIETLRDHRLRGYFGDRYDARANLCDWDYHMRLKAVASIIHVVHYKKWRLTGVAFEERLCTYTHPNRSMASYRDAKSKTRGSVSVRGYWSDTLVSPYVSLGVEADEKRLFARKNRQHVKTAPHVCEYNLLALLYELETGAPFKLPSKKDKEGAGSAASAASNGKKKLAPSKAQSKADADADTDAPVADDEEVVELPDDVPLPHMDGSAPLQASAAPASAAAAAGDGTTSSAPALCHTTPNALSLAHCRIVFLNGTVQNLAAKSRYARAFDRAYLSQFQVGCINESAAARAMQEAKEQAATDEDSKSKQPLADPVAAATSTSAAAASSSAPDSLPLNKLLRPGAIVTLETVKFLPVTAAVKDAYSARVATLAVSAGWRPASPAQSAWSPGAFHSWSGREVEQSMEEEEKQQALTQPAHLFFKFDAQPADK